jgi:glycerate 2-kinase
MELFKMATATLKNTAQDIFRQSLAACSIERAFAKVFSIRDEGGSPRLLINGIESIDLGHIKHIRVIAAGKASSSMLYALLACLKPLKHGDIAGVLIAGDRPSDLPVDFQYFAGGHPLPNEASQAGARAALEMLGTIQSNKAEANQTMVLFLISGGASAMMELPLDSSISLADTRNFYRELVHCGASIAEINCVRKHFSAIKGGRLALAADGVANLSLLISDVPPGHLDALGSGPTLPDLSTVEQCREILARHSLLNRSSESVRRFFESRDLPETPKPGILAARAITLLSSDDLAEAARTRAEALGFHAIIDNTCDDWDYRAAAEYLVDRLRSLRSIYPRVCLISSGEVTVKLSSDGTESPQAPPGLGGRNQHFSLYAATLLNSSDASTVVLSAGSDGIDGNSQAAGAVVDEQMLQPLEAGKQPAARRSLLDFDSSTFLEKLGATIVTGATGNNLRDLRILIGEPL